MKNHIAEYKSKLEKGICEYMCMPVSERSAAAVHEMFKTLRDIEERSAAEALTYDEAVKWCAKMENTDGTTGAHWDMDTTNSVARSAGIDFEHIHAFEFWATMNMMYSDYSGVAEKFGVSTPEFYADMSKAFLFDPDGGKPGEKLGAYYHGIVCPHEKMY